MSAWRWAGTVLGVSAVVGGGVLLALFGLFLWLVRVLRESGEGEA
ncbi:hypothetical protein ACL02R_00660 [Streptomyces sp. MS19]